MLLVILLCTIAAQLHGCGRGATHLRYVGTISDAPLLIHVGGWNGPVTGDERFVEALRRGGLPHELELFDWTDGARGIFALRRAQQSQAPSDKLAARIRAAHAEAPGRSIVLTGDSAGCGVLLQALGKLPADVHVQTVILASPAVSSGYDLAPALLHVRGHAYSFSSKSDWFILQWGTTIFGTVDRMHESAAGNAGFRAPADTRATPKLVQLPYDPSWRSRFDQPGGHSDPLRAKFAEGYIAPLILQDAR